MLRELFSGHDGGEFTNRFISNECWPSLVHLSALAGYLSVFILLALVIVCGVLGMTSQRSRFLLAKRRYMILDILCLFRLRGFWGFVLFCL